MATLMVMEAILPVDFADDLAREAEDLIVLALVDPQSFNLEKCLEEGWLGDWPDDHDYALWDLDLIRQEAHVDTWLITQPEASTTEHEKKVQEICKDREIFGPGGLHV